MFTAEEFADYVQLEPGDIDEGTLSVLMREARVLIQGVLPDLDLADPPERVQVVALRVVARGYIKTTTGTPYGATSMQQSAGEFSRSFGFAETSTQPGLWLTKQDRRDLRGGGRGGAFTIDLGPVNPPYFGGVDAWTSL